MRLLLTLSLIVLISLPIALTVLGDDGLSTGELFDIPIGAVCKKGDDESVVLSGAYYSSSMDAYVVKIRINGVMYESLPENLVCNKANQ